MSAGSSGVASSRTRYMECGLNTPQPTSPSFPSTTSTIAPGSGSPSTLSTAPLKTNGCPAFLKSRALPAWSRTTDDVAVETGLTSVGK